MWELRRRWSRIVSHCSLLTQQVLICPHPGHFFPPHFYVSQARKEDIPVASLCLISTLDLCIVLSEKTFISYLLRYQPVKK